MSRYLTPAKIGLLALISLYTESVVPSAATIPVLSFLISNILPIASSANGSGIWQDEDIARIDAFQKATKAHSSGIPGRTVWDLLLNKVWRINSLDALHTFFDSLASLLQNSPDVLQRVGEDNSDSNPNRMLLSRVSPLGAFVRRTQIEFTRLQFHDAITLWKSFIAYRAPTLAQWKKRNPTAGPMSFDINLQDGDLGMEDLLTNLVYGKGDDHARKRAMVSTVDVEKLLEYQVDRMQSMHAA